MNPIQESIQQIRNMDMESMRDTWFTRIHPVTKLLFTICYVLVVVSFHKYQITPLILLAVYPVIIIIMGDLSFLSLWKSMKLFFVMAFFVGIANPFFDRSTILIGNWAIRGGILSMISLFFKGSLAITAAYILICTTSFYGICFALRCLHVPKTIVMIFMLLFRYIFVFMEEADRMIQAYALRAPSQKGLHYTVWGSMIGQMILRSLDLADLLFESMRLRGFHGQLYYEPKETFKSRDLFLLIIGGILLFLLKYLLYHTI